MRLYGIFKDGMIFQANKPARIFGTGENVFAEFEGKVYPSVQCGNKFLIELPPQPYGDGKTVKVFSDKEKVIIKNVSFGEVILIAGQSNAQFRIGQESVKRDLPSDPRLRFFTVNRVEYDEAVFTEADGWQPLKSENAYRLSAIACHTGRSLREKLGVTVGVVCCYQGASTIQAWIEKDFNPPPELNVPINLRHADSTWHKFFWNKDGLLFNEMFAKLIPYSFGGAVWYQGESNTSPAEGRVYEKLLAALIENWRTCLKDENLRFTVVVICDFDGRNDDAWKSVQNAQRRITEQVKNVTTVESYDVCEHGDIHPGDKLALSKRIAASLEK